MADQITYKAIPYPLPDNVRQRLIEAGRSAIERRRTSNRAGNTEDVNLLERVIREELGVKTSRDEFI